MLLLRLLLLCGCDRSATRRFGELRVWNMCISGRGRRGRRLCTSAERGALRAVVGGRGWTQDHAGVVSIQMLAIYHIIIIRFCYCGYIIRSSPAVDWLATERFRSMMQGFRFDDYWAWRLRRRATALIGRIPPTATAPSVPIGMSPRLGARRSRTTMTGVVRRSVARRFARWWLRVVTRYDAMLRLFFASTVAAAAFAGWCNLDVVLGSCDYLMRKTQRPKWYMLNVS